MFTTPFLDSTSCRPPSSHDKAASPSAESLYRLMHDATAATAVEPRTANHHSSTTTTNPHESVAFHPVNDFKDMSLYDLLEMADDFLLDSSSSSILSNHFQDETAHRPHYEDDNSSVLDPTPLNIPDCHTVAQAALQRNSAWKTPVMVTPPAPMKTSSSSSLTAAVTVVHTTSGNNNNNNNKKKRLHSETPTGPEEEEEEKLTSDFETALEMPLNHTRFRSYQAGQWSERFTELMEYRHRHGHCLVPHTFTENLPLSRWVKRQRYQYKLWQDNKPNTMTLERIQALNQIGFVWDSQGAAWMERLEELRTYARTFGNCNVPSHYQDNPQLATWVKCQRRQYKLYHEGKTSNMNPERMEQLEALGFEWLLRSYKKARYE